MARLVRIVNQSSQVSAADLAAAVAAVQKQIILHFQPSWAASCLLEITPGAGPGQEVIYLVDHLTVPGALGYHTVAGPDTPVGFVDVALSEQIGDHWTATFSHELLEQLVDPYVSGGYLADWNGQTAFLAAEMCDPVENTEYMIDGIWVSDFITPFWFVPGPLHAGARTDYMNVLAGQPLLLARGGFVAYTTDLLSWQQSFGPHAPLHQRNARPWSRRGRRFDKLRKVRS